MSAIAMGESSGRTDAVNDGSGTNSIEYSVGLFQINTRVHKNFTVEQLKNPEINAREALRIYKSQGLRAWGSYTDGRYKRFLSAADAAYSGSPSSLPAPDGKVAVVAGGGLLIGILIVALIAREL